MPEKLLVHGYRSLPFAKVVFLYSDHYHKDHSIVFLSQLRRQPVPDMKWRLGSAPSLHSTR